METATKTYTIINDQDGNDSFEIEAKNGCDAAHQALSQLGWWVARPAEETNEFCGCRDTYTVEPHGKGFALYFGRCGHKHGLNLAYITEPDMKNLNRMLELVNNCV